MNTSVVTQPLGLVGLIFGLMLFGTVGYHLIEGWSLLDSLYMTAMVLTTVGFGEVHKPSNGGKAFSIVLMLLGIGLMLYLLALLSETLLRNISDPVVQRRRKEKMLTLLKDHTIVCGYGQVGEAVCSALSSNGRQVVVIDQSNERLEWASHHGLKTLEGDATDEEVLKRAGLEHASALISVLKSDPANLYVVLSAKSLNPTLQVITRASDDNAARKMRRAGADEVINPYQLSGNRIAALMMTPHLSKFLSGDHHGEDFLVKELTVNSDNSGLIGKSVQQLGHYSGVLIVAIWRNDSAIRGRPQEILQLGDILLVAGAWPEIDKLKEQNNAEAQTR